MAFTGPGYPNWLSAEYPGLEGMNTALHGFNYLLKDPGFGQLANSAASDPAGQGYQAASEAGAGGGGGVGAGAGLFGRLMAGQMGADVAGQAAQSQAQNSAMQGKVSAGQNAANLMANQQGSKLGLEKAQGQQAGQQLAGFSNILNMLSDPKGMGANIMQMFGGKGNQSPGGGLFELIMSLFSGMGSGGGGIMPIDPGGVPVGPAY